MYGSVHQNIGGTKKLNLPNVTRASVQGLGCVAYAYGVFRLQDGWFRV